MKIAIADDEEIYLRILKDMLSRINIIFEALNGRVLMKKLKEQRPHIIFMDISMPEINGINAAEMILKSYPDILIICWSHHQVPEQIERLRNIGVLGYLLKRSKEEELALAIESSLRGDFYLDSSLKAIHPKLNLSEDIDPRTRKLLELMAADYSMTEIADQLNVSTPVAYRLKESVMKKGKIKNSYGLITWAYQAGIVSNTSRTKNKSANV